MTYLTEKSPPEQVAYIAQLMFERNLTDIAGGNVSLRDGDIVYISPRYAGSKWHWHLDPVDIISGSIETNELLENPSFSREGLSHIAVYRSFPMVTGIIHAHAPNVLPFCSLELPMEPVIRSTKKFGVLEYHNHTPEYSQEQADSIVEKLRGKETMIQESAAAVLMPQHGIFVAGKDIWTAIDSLERINTNAWCIIARKILFEN